ncbi:hypothetical protein Adt_23507 [Abeliophyllum distichum]|uniref:Uncharacterized protein n=1 Tax=Abeliophyllum distichum TaxID=126358 RepID=A0ABD1SB26_9LAMI
MNLLCNPTNLYHFWLSITRRESGPTFYVPKYTKDIQHQVDIEYQDLWNNKVLPSLIKIFVHVLLSSESSNFALDLVVSRPDSSIPDIYSSDEHLDMSPGHRMQDFQKFSDGLNSFTIPSLLLDQTSENHGVIDTLDRIVALMVEKDLSCKQPSHISGGILASKLTDINDEEEMNFGTSVINNPETRQEAFVAGFPLALAITLPPKVNIQRVAPICSTMSRPPHRFVKRFSFSKSCFSRSHD